jgi:hypothetical protein
MAKDKKTSKESDESEAAAVATEVAPAAQATAVPQDVTVPVEGATAAPAGEGEKKKPSKPEVPEHLKKGNRVCAACGTTEADFLAKNPRYSLCQGVDVLCYRKGHRVIYGSTLEEVQAKYPDKAGKTDEKGRPMIESVSSIGVKPGILVRGAIVYSRKATPAGAVTPAETAATATPTSTATEGGTGSAGTVAAG